jgi:hypothetical protein
MPARTYEIPTRIEHIPPSLLNELFFIVHLLFEREIMSIFVFRIRVDASFL